MPKRGAPKLFLASDHAGFSLKQHLISYLGSKGYSVIDMGPEKKVADDDYPTFIIPCAATVAHTRGSRGIVIGGSGQGEAIAANKVKGIRAVVYYGGSPSILRLSREHNDANVLSLGARFLRKEEAQRAVERWLSTSFSNAKRHIRRIDKIKRYEA